MSTFSLTAHRSMYPFGATYRWTLQIIITVSGGRFIESSYPPAFTLSDGNTTVESFANFHSLNQKELIGVFATDAFAPFAGNVEVRFPYQGAAKTETFVNLNANITPPDPMIAGIILQDADTVFLATL